jgi:hypothetical protein
MRLAGTASLVRQPFSPHRRFDRATAAGPCLPTNPRRHKRAHVRFPPVRRRIDSAGDPREKPRLADVQPLGRSAARLLLDRPNGRARRYSAASFADAGFGCTAAV